MKKFLSILNLIFMVIGFMIIMIGVGALTEPDAILLAILFFIVGFAIMITSFILAVIESLD